MCEFISWIEKDNKLYYLTDAEIFSEMGKERLEGCQDNDFLGHGAIRRFYQIKGGIDHEVKDFWNYKKLPPEIAKLVKDFKKFWGKTFREYFQNDDLCFLR